jgi:hypothetical protein
VPAGTCRLSCGGPRKKDLGRLKVRCPGVDQGEKSRGSRPEEKREEVPRKRRRVPAIKANAVHTRLLVDMLPATVRRELSASVCTDEGARGSSKPDVRARLS